MNPRDIQRPLLMGIVNTTPDSFSDGGRHFESGAAVAHALRMAGEGADLIDVGGESTRPGAGRVGADEQIERTLPAIRELRRQLPGSIEISIDTTRAAVAEAALAHGASIINDISAGRDDPGMFRLAARAGCAMVLMHMQGTPATMQQDPRYEDVVREVREFLLARAEAAIEAGVAEDRIILDPGIGFSKTKAHNLALLANLDDLTSAGFPVLVGASRKRFMGSVCDEQRFDELLGATCATTALGVLAGAKIFRVHDVRANRQAAQVAWAIRTAGARR